MKIIMTKWKGAKGEQYFRIDGINEKGLPCEWTIDGSVAKTYPQAITFWKRNYAQSKIAKAYSITMGEPFKVYNYTHAC